MIKSKKQMFIIIASFALILLLGTATYAFFNYTRTGVANTIRVGRISFVSKNEQTITLNNLFPIDPTEEGIMNDATKVGTYQLTIEGDTDYFGGIEYLVSTVNSNLSTLPISIDMTIGSGLGTNDTNYFTTRDTATSPIYKKLVGDTLVGDQMLLVGFIPQNTTLGTSDETGDTITIKAYLDKNKILISDTYDGTESDNMGTPNSLAQGKTVLTTTEWNALSSSGVSFQIKVEANEGIWVNGSLEEIMRKSAVMDNINSTYVTNSTPGINFGAVSSDTNGKGVYMRAGTENDAYPILYYRGAVEDNNVIFNNKCWKAVRTTDTGGVKLIYNGEPGSVYGEKPLTENQYTIPSGTTNNFTFNSRDNSWEITITDNAAKEISFTVPAGDNYKIVQTGTSGSSTGGTWTFYKDGTEVKSYGNGGGQPMNDTYEFGTLTASNVIKWTYTGSSSVESPITFKLQMIGPGFISSYGCDNTGDKTKIILNENESNNFSFAVINNLNKSPAYVGYMYGTVYEINEKNISTTMKFGTGFAYNNGTYTLTNAKDGIANTRHYTCFTTSEVCEGDDLGKIYYVYYKRGDDYYYIELESGKSVENALSEMQTNTNSSNAKIKIDSWYASNMNTVTSKLEDTIWCNDRSMGNGNNNGWIANGGYLSTELYYGARQRSNSASNGSTVKNQPSLACANKNDAFTVSNGNGNQKLTYPVAMLTEDEMVLAGGVEGSQSTFYLNNGGTYFSMSPNCLYFYYGSEFNVNNGTIGRNTVSDYRGLRPSISLKPGLPITKGSGTVADPYVILS